MDSFKRNESGTLVLKDTDTYTNRVAFKNNQKTINSKIEYFENKIKEHEEKIELLINFYNRTKNDNNS